jgi:hypothetical protein
MLVFDESAMVALLDGYMPIYRIWASADRGHVVVAFPTAAMIAASHAADVSETAWDSLLWSASVRVRPLDEAAARHIGSWTGSVATRHVVWESRAIGWPVLTCTPDQYGPDVPHISV